ncbi:response regulator transcription factor [Halioglobus maricola]|uniref:Response regulator transcription factor n=1 Tax=Halioglobus maricola TaxID=2601894 RepID=A0A5P9NMV3_9GAMM|nr:response regulator transcription factor [Halioglobus maricola]QFU76258.1 response regulator transcription factor [Halioglobus maricola]
MKILIVDDHALFRDGLSLLLDTLAEDVLVIEAVDSVSAFDALSKHPDLDFMLLDLNIPGEDGFSVLEAMSQEYSTVPVAVLSASARQEDVDKVMATSAVGYIHKNTPSKLLLGAVQLMLAGGLYTPPITTLSEVAGGVNDEVAITGRQLEVLALLVGGDSNKQIAGKLGIAEATIKMHVTAIFKALNVKNRTQAALAGQALV